MDPPSYGRGPNKEVWRLEDNLQELLDKTKQLLADDYSFVLINSYTTGLAPSVLTYMIETEVTSKFGGHTESEEIGLPVSSNGLVLPCGASGRWVSDKI